VNTRINQKKEDINLSFETALHKWIFILFNIGVSLFMMSVLGDIRSDVNSLRVGTGFIFLMLMVMWLNGNIVFLLAFSKVRRAMLEKLAP